MSSGENIGFTPILEGAHVEEERVWIEVSRSKLQVSNCFTEIAHVRVRLNDVMVQNRGKCSFSMRAHILITWRAEYLLTVTQRGVSEKNNLSIGVKNK